MAHLYTLGRAYNLSVWSATQLLSDYTSTPEGERALQSADTVLLLRQAAGQGRRGRPGAVRPLRRGPGVPGGGAPGARHPADAPRATAGSRWPPRRGSWSCWAGRPPGPWPLAPRRPWRPDGHPRRGGAHDAGQPGGPGRAPRGVRRAGRDGDPRRGLRPPARRHRDPRLGRPPRRQAALLARPYPGPRAVRPARPSGPAVGLPGPRRRPGRRRHRLRRRSNWTPRRRSCGPGRSPTGAPLLAAYAGAVWPYAVVGGAALGALGNALHSLRRGSVPEDENGMQEQS